MKLAIMQPYFFPYIGYYQLMCAVDEWVIFDDIQFVNKGWVNRNRILHPEIDKEWQYISVPLANRKQTDKICNIEINQKKNWKDQIFGKLTSYKRKAPHYNKTVDFIKTCLEIEESNLAKFLVHTIKQTIYYLDIQTRIHVQTEMNLDLGTIEHAGQWALRISENMGADEYINPIGGKDIFKKEEFDNAGIRLSFFEPRIDHYIQRRGKFIPGLSIIDLMMWNTLDEVKYMLQLNKK